MWRVTHIEATYVEDYHFDLVVDGIVFVVDQWAIIHLQGR